MLTLLIIILHFPLKYNLKYIEYVRFFALRPRKITLTRKFKRLMAQSLAELERVQSVSHSFSSVLHSGVSLRCMCNVI